MTTLLQCVCVCRGGGGGGGGRERGEREGGERGGREREEVGHAHVVSTPFEFRIIAERILVIN